MPKIFDWDAPDNFALLVQAARMMVDGHQQTEAAAHLSMTADGLLSIRKRHPSIWLAAWDEAVKQSLGQPGADFHSRFDTAMDLAEFVESVYVPAAGCRRKQFNGRPLKPRRAEQCRYIVRLLTAYLRRPATVGDVNPATLAEFQEWHRTAFPAKSGRWLKTLEPFATDPEGKFREIWNRLDLGSAGPE